MSIRIDRLKLRLPAGTTREPKVFAEAVARGLAREPAAAVPTRIDTLNLRVPQRGGTTPDAVAETIGRAMTGKGRR